MNDVSLPPSSGLPEPVEVHCPLCGSDQTRKLYRSQEPFMQIVRCAQCRMMYQNPRVAETDMEDAYQTIDGYSRFPQQDDAKRALFRARIARFAREWALPSRGYFLDVGAARGIMLDCVRSTLPDWEVAAVELSPSARGQLIARGYRTEAFLDGLPGEAKFDWINIDNVLEHLPDPRRTLASLKDRLQRNGRIYVEVPNESLLSVRYRVNDLVRGFRKLPTAEGHVNLFTPHSLRAITEAAGLRPERIWLESVSIPYRLKAALGAEETPRIRRVLDFLRATQLDVHLRLAYFICCMISNPD